ncbi:MULTISPECIES: hypothetical protein [unclassified Marinitoga]|uniref:hypothetical protein n=1 Tax=unclassified Marinitoga TaxID=2640159 RepID=UPI000640F887|nr:MULTISPECIES: hypothetical protein [unclassified Marinitoga]KLO24157.1 hypothetical protein X274_04695 [Marinitoga sp. 1155]NUU99332.1 hypothetical protein [Marinitoga sp. 1154]
MNKKRWIYLISIFLTFIPFNWNSGLVLFIFGTLFSFLYIRIRKFGMPYYIAFLALFGIFMFTFFLLNATGSKNLYYSLNIIAIVILSYYLPGIQKDTFKKDIIRFTFLFLIALILLRNLINPLFPLIALLLSLFELLKDQKNKIMVISLYLIFILFSLINFNYYYNPFKELHFSPDTQLLNEKRAEEINLENSLTQKKDETEIKKIKDKFSNNITPEERKTILLNNKIVDTIILINIAIGGFIAIILAIIIWKLLGKNEKKKVVISLIIFFSVLLLIGTGISYMERGREPMVNKSQNSINLTEKDKPINAISASKITDIFREIANSPKSAYVKLYQPIKWLYLVLSILFGILVIMAIKKFFKNQKEDIKKIKKFSIEKIEKEDIPYIIEEGYKYIRKRFFKSFSHLTPYELLCKISYPKEFELLTNLFVLKEYGEKNYDYTKNEIKNIIMKSIEFFNSIPKNQKSDKN